MGIPTYAVKKELTSHFSGQKTSNPLTKQRIVKLMMTHQAPHLFTGERYGRSVMFCVSQAFRKRRKMMPQQIQEMNPDVFVKFTNQLKTTALSLPTFRYARTQNNEEAVTAQYGTPDLVHALKTEGALPDRASAYSEREDKNRKEFPDDHALMMIPALMMLSSTGMPAFLIPATKGEEPAPEPPDVMMGSSEGQMIPIASTLPT